MESCIKCRHLSTEMECSLPDTPFHAGLENGFEDRDIEECCDRNIYEFYADRCDHYDRSLKTTMNRLAREFYKVLGCNARPDYDFFLAHHPLEKQCLAMAEIAYTHFIPEDEIDYEDDDGEPEGFEDG